MKKFLASRDGASKGAALLIALAMVVLFTGLALAYFSRTTTDRQLAHSSYNDTSAEMLARTALDIVVSDFKQEILPPPPATPPPITRANIQPAGYTPVPQVAGSPIPNLIRQSFFGDPTGRTSNVNSGTASANGRSISRARWNSHYLVPRANPGNNALDSSPVSSFTAPDWVLVTAQGPTPGPSPNAVIGRYAFAVYDEGGLLDMSMAGYPSWSGLPNASCSPNPSATPWLVNVGRKGIMAFADLTALPTSNASPAPTFPPAQINNIVGWRNYATTLQSFSGFPTATPSFTTDCIQQASYGDYFLDFGDPPFSIESLSDKLLASTYPFTSIWPNFSNGRTDQAVMSRQELLRLQRSLDNPPGSFSQNVLQYMGTFSRERNWPAPDWPNLNGHLSDGRFNMNNLALVIPNPLQCNIAHGQKRGWLTGKNKTKLCGSFNQLIELFGLFWVSNPNNDNNKTPGHWRYIWHTGPDPNGSPSPDYNSIICWDPNANRYQARQPDFFQILNYALNVSQGHTDHCGGAVNNQARTFGIGASLIDQYDSGAACFGPGATGGIQPPGCDIDWLVQANYGWKNATHTTIIQYGQGGGGGSSSLAYGMELNYSDDPTNGDAPCDDNHNDRPHRPSGAPIPISSSGNGTIVVNRAFSSVGDFGYGIDTSALLGPSPTCPPSPTPGPTALPILNSSSPTFPDAPILDFFCYNPISSAYPRAGIVNLFTKNAPVLAAILKGTILNEASPASRSPTPTPTPDPTPVVSQDQAMAAATQIVQETQNVLAGTPVYGPVTQTDLTRAIAARLAAAGGSAIGSTTEQKEAIARALAEMGQTRTWNLFIDVIAQTGKYKPNSPNLTASNFVVEGEKRYWLHIALGRDLIHADGTPCQPEETGCQVDVLGTQLEEVIE